MFQGRHPQKNTIFRSKMEECQFWARISVFWVRVVSLCPPYPILSLLDSKHDVLYVIDAIQKLSQGHYHNKIPVFAQKWRENAIKEK